MLQTLMTVTTLIFLGICTYNAGLALATLMGVAGVPHGAITLCILAIFLGAILSGFAAAAKKRFGARLVTGHDRN